MSSSGSDVVMNIVMYLYTSAGIPAVSKTPHCTTGTHVNKADICVPIAFE